MSEDNAQVISNPVNTQLTLPTPREFNGKLYYGAADVAKILDVSKVAVWKWHNELFMGAPQFQADTRAHDGRYLYDVERVMQLKAVYRPNWTRGSYEPEPPAATDKPKDKPKVKIKAQYRNNLPAELANQPRFFQVATDKVPVTTAWQKPENQRPIREVKGWAGLAVHGGGVHEEILFLDFDHVFDDAGEFVTAKAAEWFNRIQDRLHTFCELSASKHGLHLLAVPTAGKFEGKLASGSKAKLYLNDEDIVDKGNKDAPALEIFFQPNGRYCLVTGDMFRCEPKTPLARGAAVDDVLQELVTDIARQQAKAAESARQDNLFASSSQDTPQSKPSTPRSRATSQGYDPADDPAYNDFRARQMFESLRGVPLDRDDWLPVVTALKNLGFSEAEVEEWSKADADHYNAANFKKEWNSLTDPYDISVLHAKAMRHSRYSERETRREWFVLHPELSRQNKLEAELNADLADALVWLDALTPENFTADDAHNRNNLYRVAVAMLHGETGKAEKFFAVIKQAKDAAKIRISDAKSGLTEPLTFDEETFLNALVEGTNIKSLRSDVDREVASIKRSLDEARSRQAQQKAREDYQKEQAARAERIKTDADRLKELRAMPPSTERDAEIVQLLNSLCEWKQDRQGKPVCVKATAANINLIFVNDPALDGLVGYDEFQQADVLLKAPPWNAHAHKGDEWSDRDDAQLQMYLRETYTEFTNEKLILNAITKHSDAHRFHELKEFFASLPHWDGVKRAETLFIKFLRAKDNDYTRELTLNWLTAAVARVFYPGCDYQNVPIILGNQGIGKSHLLSKLGGKWYGALIDDVDDPHAIDTIQRLWIIEVKELAPMRRDVRANKSFFDAAHDTRRFAYERRAKRILRHCVFAGTTNDRECLIDPTGNRRYPIIECHAAPRDFVEGLTDEYVQQVWAEVLQHFKELFKDGFVEAKLSLSRASQIQADAIAEKHLADDGMTTEIKGYVDTLILPQPLWLLLTRDERRAFIKNGKLIFTEAEAEFNTRRRAQGGNPDVVQRDVNAITDCLRPSQQKPWLRIEHKKTPEHRDIDEYILYGAEPRQHICAAEIFNECFGTDRRKSMKRISEILTLLDGWTIGERIQKADPQYPDQKKPYYRNT